MNRIQDVLEFFAQSLEDTDSKVQFLNDLAESLLLLLRIALFFRGTNQLFFRSVDFHFPTACLIIPIIEILDPVKRS